jgi:hypothetical protein
VSGSPGFFTWKTLKSHSKRNPNRKLVTASPSAGNLLKFCHFMTPAIPPDTETQALSASVEASLSADGNCLKLADGWEVPLISLDGLVLNDADFIRGPRKNKADPRNQRYIYRNAARRMYTKIWSPQYARAATFVNALRIGFYDRGLCSALAGIVVSADLQCRGYLMREGELLKHEVPESLLRPLLANSVRTGHFYYDLVRCVIRVEDAYSLTDLEGVYEFSQLAPYWRARLIGKRTHGCVASPMSYHRALSRLRDITGRTAGAAHPKKEIDRLVQRLPFVIRNQ